MPRLKLTKTAINALSPTDRDTVYWDTDLKGFGVRVQPTGTMSYIVQANAKATRRKHKKYIGSISSMTLAEARDAARPELLAIIYGPSRSTTPRETTIDELWSQFVEGTNHHRKSRSNKEYEGSYRNWISPHIGRMRVAEVTRAEVDRFLKLVMIPGSSTEGSSRLKGGIHPAIHARSTLSAMLSFAVERDLVSQNVCLQVRLKQPEGSIRSLSRPEVERLGNVFHERVSQGRNLQAISILRLLMLTGARKEEICSLRWSYLHLSESIARLPDSKTGPKTLQLPQAAVDILLEQKRIEGSPWVFPASSGTSRYQGLQKVWDSIRREARIQDVRIHDLRHTYGTWGIECGAPLYGLRDVLKHKNVATTEKYLHASQTSARGVSRTLGTSISDALGLKTEATDQSVTTGGSAQRSMVLESGQT